MLGKEVVMAVLVTGGAGYIGSIATEKLAQAGENVVVLDNLATGHRQAIHPDAVFVQGDIQNRSLLIETMRAYAIDAVLHFAAFIVVSESCAKPGLYFGNNTFGAHTVLDAMREAGVSKFIFSSTAAVYGHPDSVPIGEEAAIRPLNPYGISKRMVEEMLAWHDQAHGLRYTALRYFNAAGATVERGEDHYPETHLIPNVLAAASGDTQAIEVFGSDYATPDGTCIRDYVHIEDLIDAHLRALSYLRDGGSSQIINLGSSTGVSVLEVIDAVQRVTGKAVTVQMSARRPGDSTRLVASSQKAHEVLGWFPRKGDIETIVEDAWAWRLKHPEGYAD